MEPNRQSNLWNLARTSAREALGRFSFFLLLLLAWGVHAQTTTNAFVNWETAPIHPVALSPDGATLALCNLPDNRVEIFTLTNGVPRSVGAVAVGLDPVSLRFRTHTELWVVNRISDSISVVDLPTRRVKATLDALEAPADVVFAGQPLRAFVSCANANAVLVIDPVSRARLATLTIDGERPKAMGVSPDGRQVYVAIFESGNRTTILAPTRIAGLTDLAAPGVLDFPDGPHGGLNPPPNAGLAFDPALNPKLPTNASPPRVGLIVRQEADGRWRDDNHGDWTDYVSGSQSAFTGRPAGWNLADHDVAVINADNLGIRYLTNLMNLNLDLAVNPASGLVTVVGTEAMNQTRFEPRLRGVFTRVQLALADPQGATNSTKDLNPHLDYTVPSLPDGVRQQSIGDPRGIVWNGQGTRAYVTGMGSGKLVVLDARGDRVEPKAGIKLGAGAAGLVLDEPRQRLYVLNRFDASVSVVETITHTVVATVKFHDPTPVAIKAGRPHLYDTHKTSGLGQASCASCHVDARSDRLAWDLGDPVGVMASASVNRNFGQFAPAVVNDFHPMKGPMVTQTLQDIIGHEPFHWRGDRDGLEEFNSTFTNLQAAASLLTTNEMREFKAFLATISLPPNRLRNLDNSLATNVPLSGMLSLGRGALPAGAPFPPGNAAAGLAVFLQLGARECASCHTLPTGMGVDRRWTGINFQNMPLGPNGEHHVALVQLERSLNLPFKIPQLRTLRDKLGADFSRAGGRAGFGLMHDGRADSLVHFLQDGFDFRDDRDTANLAAFLLSLAGADLPAGSPNNRDQPPGVPSLDVPAAVGRQVTLATPATTPLLDTLFRLANSSTSRVDLVVKGVVQGMNRGWHFDRATGSFQADRKSERIAFAALRANAGPGQELTWTAVPRGSGRRIGIDRDSDGFLDQDEVDLGSDPADASSIPVIRGVTLRVSASGPVIGWSAAAGHTYRVQYTRALPGQAWTDLPGDVTAGNGVASKSDLSESPGAERYYRVILIE